MCPKLIFEFFLLSIKKEDIPYSKISLNYIFVFAGALGALGRRFESCRPDSHSS